MLLFAHVSVESVFKKAAAASLLLFSDCCISYFLAIIVDHGFVYLYWPVSVLCVSRGFNQSIGYSLKTNLHHSEKEPDELYISLILWQIDFKRERPHCT